MVETSFPVVVKSMMTPYWLDAADHHAATGSTVVTVCYDLSVAVISTTKH